MSGGPRSLFTMASSHATWISHARDISSVVHEALDQRQLLLASLPPSQLQNRLACGIVVTMLVLFVVTLRYVNVQLPRVDAFIPIHAITTLINDLITAGLLFSQYSIERRRTLLVLASGYLFTSLIVIPWALTFPGLFAPTGLLGPGLQTTAWLYVSWHMGSPLILIIAVLLKDSDSKPSESRRSPAAAVGLSIAVATATVCGLTWITIAGERFLPRIVLPDGIHLNQSLASSLGGLIMVLAGGALALLWIRRRSVLDDSHRASAVISGIRSMFQKGAHGQILLDVNELVRETLTMIDLDLRTYGISVKADLRDGVLHLSGDRGQLQQVFLNLISNAIEAMNSVTDRARNLQVRTNVVQESSDVVVTVEDSGTGLEGEDKDRIFEPFFTTKSTGTGVGLTICRVIIESHGGSLKALPNKPYGAIFEVTLPSGDL